MTVASCQRTLLFVLVRPLFRIRRKQPMFKSILRALLKLLGAKALEAAPEAVKVVRDGLKGKK